GAAGAVLVLLAICGQLYLSWQSARRAEGHARAEKKHAQAEKERADQNAKDASQKQALAEEATRRVSQSLKDAKEAQHKEALAAASAKAALREAVAGKLLTQSRAILEGQRAATADIALLLGATGYRLNPDNEAYGGLQYALNATS